MTWVATEMWYTMQTNRVESSLQSQMWDWQTSSASHLRTGNT